MNSRNIIFGYGYEKVDNSRFPNEWRINFIRWPRRQIIERLQSGTNEKLASQ